MTCTAELGIVSREALGADSRPPPEARPGWDQAGNLQLDLPVNFLYCRVELRVKYLLQALIPV